MTQDNQVPPLDPIQHVVLLMLENHSFDQMLGCFQSIYPELDGVNVLTPRFNIDLKGNKTLQAPVSDTQIPLDPGHDCPNVMTQLADNNAGFIKDFISKYPASTVADREHVMGYYPLGFLPALHQLAHEFIICDHWFSSVPGPTWPNRFFALSGTSSGHVTMPEGLSHPDLANAMFDQDQKTIFDCLNEAGKTWKNYFYDFPLSLVLTQQRHPHNLINYHKIEHFFKDAAGPSEHFPAFVFIEPKYLDVDQNDDHPPHNTMKAEKLIADVYNAIRSNQALWESTLFIVTYDEHGGFYDHVHPPKTIPPDEHTEEFAFDQLGVRVPTVLISPWLKKGVEKTVFDHTSLLHYLIDKWQLSGLGERTYHANSLAMALHFEQQPRVDTTPFIRVPNKMLIPKKPELEQWDKTTNHEAIHRAADYLEQSMGFNLENLPCSLPTWDLWKQKTGQLIIKFGRWLEKDAYHYRKNRIVRSGEIVDRIISQ